MTTLVVRPSVACRETCDFLQNKGVSTQPLPLLDIEPILPPHGLLRQFISAADVLVATSANVYFSLYCNQAILNPITPLCAVGTKTANELSGLFPEIRLPTQHNSEGLIELLKQHPQWKRIVLLKGEGGRKEIVTQMTKSGSCVQSLALYRRVINNQIDPTNIHWQYVSHIVVTSVELALQLVNRYPVLHYPAIRWIVLSDRIATALKTVGVSNISQSSGTNNQAIYEAICK